MLLPKLAASDSTSMKLVITLLQSNASHAICMLGVSPGCTEASALLSSCDLLHSAERMKSHTADLQLLRRKEKKVILISIIPNFISLFSWQAPRELIK